MYVATDDQRIFDIVKKFGGNAVMTSEDHPSGTDRCAEALKIISRQSGNRFDYVINIQGDEPFIQTTQIQMLIDSFKDKKTDIATLAKRISCRDEIFDVNKPKIVFSQQNYALYFSRSPVPHIRNLGTNEWPGEHVFYKHIGIYAYKAEVLKKLSKLQPSSLEKAESLEQLRWLQNGYKIRVSETEFETIGIDTPEDLKTAENML